VFKDLIRKFNKIGTQYLYAMLCPHNICDFPKLYKELELDNLKELLENIYPASKINMKEISEILSRVELVKINSNYIKNDFIRNFNKGLF
jgi:hypothetical protein